MTVVVGGTSNTKAANMISELSDVCDALHVQACATNVRFCNRGRHGKLLVQSATDTGPQALQVAELLVEW